MAINFQRQQFVLFSFLKKSMLMQTTFANFGFVFFYAQKKLF